jgi:hypothetical protein
MLLIDEPYVSDFLIDTIRDYHFKIISTPIARELINDDALEWLTENDAIKLKKSNSLHPLYSISENGLDWIEQNLKGSELARQISVLKDKFKFRELIKNTFPNFYFKQVSLEELHRLAPDDVSFPFVVKPSIGFFSIGVHIIKNKEDWLKAKNELQAEKLKSIFPESVLNTNHFIIEEFIPGEEYAIDYYHDQDGKVVILNILHHLFSSGSDTSDRVYTTSKNIITQHKSKIEDFLTIIGEELNLKNFPAHAEVRIDEHGAIRPIEINPLRFGGWCTSADLLGITVGFNSYDYFFKNKTPDWEAIFKGKEDKLFSIIVLNNSSGIEAAHISNFDYSRLADHFENPVLIRKLDITQYSIFGFVFAETSQGNEQELHEILTSDLREYIIWN